MHIQYDREMPGVRKVGSIHLEAQAAHETARQIQTSPPREIYPSSEGTGRFAAVQSFLDLVSDLSKGSQATQSPFAEGCREMHTLHL